MTFAQRRQLPRQVRGAVAEQVDERPAEVPQEAAGGGERLPGVRDRLQLRLGEAVPLARQSVLKALALQVLVQELHLQVVQAGNPIRQVQLCEGQVGDQEVLEGGEAHPAAGDLFGESAEGPVLIRGEAEVTHRAPFVVRSKESMCLLHCESRNYIPEGATHATLPGRYFRRFFAGFQVRM